MGVVTLSLETLPKLDGGKIAALVNTLLKQAAADCMDRPGDKSSRKITIELTLSPLVAPDGSCESIELAVDGSCKLPKQRTRKLNLGANVKGGLWFSEGSPDRAAQTTFDEADSTGRVQRPPQG